MTEQEKMLAGKIYDSSDETLLAIRTKAHKLCQTYNQTADTEEKAREQIMRDLIPDCAKGVYLQGPIYFDYGKFTTIGENTFANFNFTVLDTCPVHIGNNVFIGPNVSLVRSVTSSSGRMARHTMMSTQSQLRSEITAGLQAMSL